MDVLFVVFILLSLVFLFIIISQQKKIQVLEEENRKLRINESNDDLIATAKDKLREVGNVKTIKYVREETGMSLLEAKQFVDALEESR